jgi:hypothetical protein
MLFLIQYTYYVLMMPGDRWENTVSVVRNTNVSWTTSTIAFVVAILS